MEMSSFMTVNGLHGHNDYSGHIESGVSPKRNKADTALLICHLFLRDISLCTV